MLDSAPPASAPSNFSRVRLAAVVALFVLLWIVAKATGLIDDVDASRLRSLVTSWGAWGIAGFLLLFALSEFFHIPGLVFFAAAVLAWDAGPGFAIGYAGAILRVCVSFAVVRAIGGRPLATIDRPWLKRMLQRLDRHPALTVAALRIVFIMSFVVNYALAFTNLRWRDYLIGSALGLLPPLAVATVLFDWLLA